MNPNWKLHFWINGDNNEYVIPKPDFNPITVPAFFNSDFDSIGFSVNKLSSWILAQMGYGKLDDMLVRVSQFIDANTKSDIRLSSNLKSEEIDELIKAIILYEDRPECNDEITAGVNANKFDSNKQHKFFIKLWHSLASNVMETENESGLTIGTVKEDSNDEEKQQRLRNLYKILNEAVDIKNEVVDNNKEELITKKVQKIKELKEEKTDSILVQGNSMEEIEKIKSFLEGVKKKIKDIQNNIVSDFINDNKDFIEKIMSDFSNKDENFKFINYEKEKVRDLELKITFGINGKHETTPNEYLNAFRFKLYVLTLKLTIALHWMKKYEMAAPIVIDDVFNASDFENSIKLEQYILSVKRIYSDMLERKEVKYPMQLIILTHDNMVFNSIRYGLIAMNKSEFQDHGFDESYFSLINGRIYRLDEIVFLPQDQGYKDFINIYK